MTTLNQIIDKLRLIADGHQQINTFKHGQIVDYLAGQVAVEYPAMFSECTTLRIGRREVEYNFSLFFLDKIKEDLSNETEVQSDMVLVASDVLAQMTNNPSYEFRLPTNGQYSGELYTEASEDLVAGVKIDITIKADAPADKCAIPGTITT